MKSELGFANLVQLIFVWVRIAVRDMDVLYCFYNDLDPAIC
jgi:hypothetical protein